jgi:ribosomal-protein-alanine N-acetyltransferase
MSVPKHQLPALEFVPLADAHIETMLGIEHEAYPEPWSQNMFRDEVRNGRSHFYVAMLGDEIAGYGGFWLVLDEAHITSIAVRDCHRGQGYGRAIATYVLNEAIKVSANMATLEVRVGNIHARNLYLSLGFRPIGLRRGYYPANKEDAVVMLKDLA